ncbi:MAG: PIG-L family deacetylase [Abditibacteriota bacterium]|nr:PIG-L family deacetylase [Abditibacteriota bacterium]
MNKVALATCAHPDDIEFVTSGTLMLLNKLGWEIHYMTLSNGSCGSTTLNAEEIGAKRVGESKKACEYAGFIHHDPITVDLEIFYQDDQIRKVCSVIREVKPAIILTTSPQDYMEDHMNACRLTVTAAFAKAMPNYKSIPEVEACEWPLAIYHACPQGLCDMLGNPVIPDFGINVDSVINNKVIMMRNHESQYKFLEETQGKSDYIDQMKEQCEDMAKVFGKCQYAEGFRKHFYLGFGPEDFDPLKDALKDFVVEK